MELAKLQTPAERATAGRSRTYQLLGMAFAFPDEEFFADIRDGTFRTALRETCAMLPYDILDATKPLGSVAGDPEEFGSEYIRLFDVGTSGPPCPLYGGTYIGDRMKVMEDAVRFYNFFELHMSPEMHELPDHITTELEFLHYLTYRETEARQQDGDTASLLRAERDFLARHLCRWVPRLQAKLARQETNPFFPALVEFANRFFTTDQAYAAAAAEEFD